MSISSSTNEGQKTDTATPPPIVATWPTPARERTEYRCLNCGDFAIRARPGSRPNKFCVWCGSSVTPIKPAP